MIRGSSRAIPLLTASLFVACGGEGSTAPPPGPEATISLVAETYLNEALDIMQAHSINRYEIDWPTFRERTFLSAGGAQAVEDTYDAIRFALEMIQDNHSRFVPKGSSEDELDPPSPSASLVGGRIGYLLIPGGAPNASDAQGLIEGLDTLGVCGWVVDLRGNTGGNMWPMIAGVGPIVGEGILGFFVDPDSVVLTWTYEGGASRLNGGVISQVLDPYSLLAPDPPVAVLTDYLTISSGEATAIAFRGRPNSRSFGQPSRGLSTANTAFHLSDGSKLILTVSTMANRTGRLYGTALIPDSLVTTRYPTPTRDPLKDRPLAAGMEWVRSQPACDTS